MDQYVGQQEKPAKCYHIVQNDGPPIGFIWIAFACDEYAPDCLYVHVDYVFVIPTERGGMSEWLSGEVLREFRSWVDLHDAVLKPGATVYSTSSPVSQEGNGFVGRLNARLKAYGDERKFRFVGHET